MFKSLDLIESFGSGIGKAKKAMLQNGSDNIHYEEYDENIDITSVIIPISKSYSKYSNIILSKESKGRNLDIQDQNLDIQDQNLDIQDQNLDIDNISKIKLNEGDVKGIINRSNYSSLIKKTLLDIYDANFDGEFSRSLLVEQLKASKSSCANYISYLLSLNIIEPVKGKGKGRYRFK